MSYETVRIWVARFGPLIARCLRRRRGRSSGIWHLDEMFVRIAGRQVYSWRAVDSEAEVLDMLVQSRSDCRAAGGAQPSAKSWPRERFRIGAPLIVRSEVLQVGLEVIGEVEEAVIFWFGR